MEANNSFEQGLNRDFDARRSSDRSLYDGENGTIIYHENGSVVWRPTSGNAVVLQFDGDTIDPDDKPPAPIGGTTLHMPMGGCSFEDCCVILTINTTTEDTTLWVFQFTKDRQAYGQILLSDASFPPEDRFNGTLLEPVVMRPVYENSQIYRVYWCDGVSDESNPLRALSFRISGTVTDPTYSGMTVYGTFNTYVRLDGQSPSTTDIMAPWWPGRIWFKQRIPGQLMCGSYQYVYRQIRADGYRTPWSMPTNPIHNTTDPVNASNMHLYEMEAPNQQTAFGIRIMVQGIDERYEQIEVGYVYITDPDVPPTIGASFAIMDVDTTGADKHMMVDHISMTGEPFSPEEINMLRMNIRAAQTIEVKDNRLWAGNYKIGMMSLDPDEVETVLADFKCHHFFRDMCGDEKGKTDKCEDIHGESRPFTHINPTTTTLDFWLNSAQTITLDIVSDYRNYKGQQISNLFVGHPRDEKGRYGLVFYDLVGQPGFVYHLCDYKFPKIYNGDQTSDVEAIRIDKDGNLVNVLDDSLWLSGDMRNSWFTTNMGDDLSIVGGTAGALGTNGERPITDDAHDNALTGTDDYGWTISLLRVMGMLMHGIDVSSIKTKISGFSIVRCPMEYTTVAQGLVSPCVIDGDEIRPMPRPAWAGVIDSNPASGTYGRFQWGTESGDPLWDTEDVRDDIFMSYNFLNIYFANVLFDPETRPGLQSGDSLELVQVLWEEYNDKSEIAYPVGEPLGRRMNLVHAGPTTSTATRSEGDKLSFHLLNMSREVRPDPAGTLVFDGWDGTHFTNGGNNFPLGVLTGASTHPSTAAYRANWAAAEFMFPLYGSTISFEYVKWIEMNEELAGIDPGNPTWQFLNKVRCFYSNGGGGGGIPDPLFGGINDNVALNIPNSMSGGSRWEGIGHDQTALVKYVDIAGPNGESAKYPLAAIFPAYAETSLGGPGSADGGGRKHGPMIGSVARWLVNWKRPMGAVYGGQTLSALQNNIFIPIGHFQPVNNPAYTTPTNDIYDSMEVWGGDCYLDFHSAAVMLPNYCHDGGTSDPASREVADTGWVITYPTEQRFNHVMRNAPSPGNPISSGVGIQPRQTYEGFSSRGTGGIFFYGGLNGRNVVPTKHYLEEFFISALMRLENRLRLFAVKPRAFLEVDHFALRWAYAEVKYYGALVDAFRTFLVNSWADTDGQYGPVQGSVHWANEIWSFQTKAISRLLINEKSLIKDEAGDTITTGTGQTLAGYDVKVHDAGTQHRMSIAAGNSGVFFVDAQGRAIYHFDGQKANNIGRAVGMNTMLADVLRHYKWSQTVWSDKKGTGIFTGFDQVTSNVYFNLTSRVGDFMAGGISQRYKYHAITFTNTTTDVYGASLPGGLAHDYIAISPLDWGSYVIENATTPEIRDQDILVLTGWPSPTMPRPVYIDLLLYRGIIQNAAFTVKEFYLVIYPTLETNKWLLNVRNIYNPSPTLAEPNQVWPDRTEDRPGYRFVAPGYGRPEFVPYEVAPTYGVVFHFYRPDGDAVFQVRMLSGNGSRSGGYGIGAWLNPRSVFIYNEANKLAQGWESVGNHFNLAHEQRLLQARENYGATSDVYERVDHALDTPRLYGMSIDSWIQFIVRGVQTRAGSDLESNKIFDNLMIQTAEQADVKTVRFSTEEQAILLSMSGEQRAVFKRSLLRMPIRTVAQLARMRGTYLLVDVHVEKRRMKVAYVSGAKTLYRISNKT